MLPVGRCDVWIEQIVECSIEQLGLIVGPIEAGRSREQLQARMKDTCGTLLVRHESSALVGLISI